MYQAGPRNGGAHQHQHRPPPMPQRPPPPPPLSAYHQGWKAGTNGGASSVVSSTVSRVDRGTSSRLSAAQALAQAGIQRCDAVPNNEAWTRYGFRGANPAHVGGPFSAHGNSVFSPDQRTGQGDGGYDEQETSQRRRSSTRYSNSSTSAPLPPPSNPVPTPRHLPWSSPVAPTSSSGFAPPSKPHRSITPSSTLYRPSPTAMSWANPTPPPGSGSRHRGPSYPIGRQRSNSSGRSKRPLIESYYRAPVHSGPEHNTSAAQMHERMVQYQRHQRAGSTSSGQQSIPPLAARGPGMLRSHQQQQQQHQPDYGSSRVRQAFGPPTMLPAPALPAATVSRQSSAYSHSTSSSTSVASILSGQLKLKPGQLVPPGLSSATGSCSSSIISGMSPSPKVVRYSEQRWQPRPPRSKDIQGPPPRPAARCSSTQVAGRNTSKQPTPQLIVRNAYSNKGEDSLQKSEDDTITDLINLYRKRTLNLASSDQRSQRHSRNQQRELGNAGPSKDLPTAGFKSEIHSNRRSEVPTGLGIALSEEYTGLVDVSVRPKTSSAVAARARLEARRASKVVTASADSPPQRSFGTQEQGSGSDGSSLQVGRELTAALRMMRAPSVLGAGEDIDFTDERVFRESEVTRSLDEQPLPLNSRSQDRSSNATQIKPAGNSTSGTSVTKQVGSSQTQARSLAGASKVRPPKAVERQAVAAASSSVAPLRIRPKKVLGESTSGSQNSRLPYSTNVSSRTTSLAPSRVGSSIGVMVGGSGRSRLQEAVKRPGPSKLGTSAGATMSGGTRKALVPPVAPRISALSQLKSVQMQATISESSVYSQTSAPDTASTAASIADGNDSDEDDPDEDANQTEREVEAATPELDRYDGSDTEIDESATAALRIIQSALEKALGCDSSSTGSTFVDSPLKQRLRTGSDAESSSLMSASSSSTLVHSRGSSSIDSVNMSSSTSLASSDDSESSAASMRVLGVGGKRSGKAKANKKQKQNNDQLDASKKVPSTLRSQMLLASSKKMVDEPSKQSFATNFSVSSTVSRLRPPQARGLPEEIQELLHSLAVSTSAELRNQSGTSGTAPAARGRPSSYKMGSVASSSMTTSSTLRDSKLKSGLGPSKSDRALGTAAVSKPAPLRLKSLKLCKEVNSSKLSTASSARKTLTGSSSSVMTMTSGSNRIAALRESELRASPSVPQKDRRGSAWTTSSSACSSHGADSMFSTTSMATTGTNTSQTTFGSRISFSSAAAAAAAASGAAAKRQSRLPVPVGSAWSSRETSVDSELGRRIGAKSEAAAARLPPSTLIRQIQRTAFAAAAQGGEA